MAAPTPDRVRSYYNERVEGKLRDFTDLNPRIEAAVQLIAEWAPGSPRRVLEIGCGVGATSWRMARAWPQAQVVGSDISQMSIEVAQTCFQRPNLTYRAGPLAAAVTENGFDLIVMTDVYEHITPADRAALHAALREMLSDECRLVFTVPTPRLQQEGRSHVPDAIQPVDEDIGMAEILRVAEDTRTHLLYYREVGIWNYGDYAHFVLGRCEHLRPVEARAPRPGGMRHHIKRWLGAGAPTHGDYLGDDVLRAAPRDTAGAFQIPLSERRRLASAWSGRCDR